MDRSAIARKRRNDAPQPAPSSTRVAPDQTTQPEKTHHSTSGKIRTAKNSNEIIRLPRRTDVVEIPSSDGDSSARHFTVANVGKGGTMYMKPSKLPPATFPKTPATPPDTSDGDTVRTQWSGARQSDVSGTWTPRLQGMRGSNYDHRIPVPPVSLSNVHPKRRPRSHSLSTVSDHMRTPTLDVGDLQILLNGVETRPKSSVDLSAGLLDLHIPHYRLGTPAFTDRGTAYLHNSMYTSTTDDVRSSVFSRAEFDKLFPAPPGAAGRPSFISRKSSSPYLHPSHAAYSRTPSASSPLSHTGDSVTDVSTAVYDKIEANPDDPSMVRFNASTGRIAAATPARLVAQITSPVFLDYELLSDFFLTFRSFMLCRDLLEYLLARLKWALGAATDSGRIVRVRTFVALRHWILNYFGDDFMLDKFFRQRFCDLVNDLARHLRQRHDHGGSDINIVGELKKCWRRTCATFWPYPDALDTSPDTDIMPCGEQVASAYAPSTASVPLTVVQHPSKEDLRQASTSTGYRGPVDQQSAYDRGNNVQGLVPGSEMTRSVRTTSIPTSPMSEHSLQVLSCSVPFLRHTRPAPDTDTKSSAPRPAGPQRNPQLSEKPSTSLRQHKRSGSFSDALRDGRTPLPSNKVDSVDFKVLQAATYTGGLVRGLLLQPSPAKVDLLVPLSPGLDLQARDGAMEDTYFDGRSIHSQGVKKIVGDVRRALSSRKGPNDFVARSHRSAGSSDSRSSANLIQHEKSSQRSAWQQLRGPPRIDMLGSRIGESYKDAFQDSDAKMNADMNVNGEQDLERNRKLDLEGHEDEDRIPQNTFPGQPSLARFNSGVTTGTRSIVIVDDTGVPEVPKVSGTLPSVSSMSSEMMPRALFRRPEEVFQDYDTSKYHAVAGPLRQPVSESHITVQRHSPEPPMPDVSSDTDYWRVESLIDHHDKTLCIAEAQARKSSSIHPSGYVVPQVRNQLRRRPGGDLKAADHVHELEPLPRSETAGSFSTLSRSQTTSTVLSNDLSGTHFSGQGLASWRMPDHTTAKNDSVALLETHSSQPNLRPSFQAQVSKLAMLSGQSYDGGVEDTLLRLEGKTSSPSDRMFPEAPRDDGSEVQSSAKHGASLGPLRIVNGSISADGSTTVDEAQRSSPRTETQGASIYHPSGSDASSQPILRHQSSSTQRDAGDRAPVLPKASQASRFPIDQSESGPRSEKSVAFAEKPSTPVTAQGDRVAKPDDAPTSATPQGSFLLDDNESLSDISTDIADHPEDENLGMQSFFFDDTVDEDIQYHNPFQPPPTPPSTVGAPQDASPESEPSALTFPLKLDHPLKEAASAPKLLSPNRDRQEHYHKQLPVPSADLRRVKTSPAPDSAAHLPFILAFESEVIAEQLTIIEKDALDEVDWKDLIAINWHQSPPHVRNWVDYLKQDDGNGIDVIVARFNLVVKWVVSECILTDAPSERARCITKFIHIASHCHRYRNYASMYQITLALLSSDLARLHRTWALVAPAEKQKLERLEKLCQPLHNFSVLRAEMESSNLESGCIPFIGLYTHDLMFNAQKPSRIDPTAPSKEPLINFERYQTAAMIVKSLLRLIEASSKYIFHPHPEVLSRCLWLAALEDPEISARSKTLEQ